MRHIEAYGAYGSMRGTWNLGGIMKLVGHVKDDFDNVRMS